ncbi:tRNA-guanine transglycosylase [Deinococcus sp. 6YEL10]|uniref:tRNA-guanine transglycosylase n=1 Tax=Deinococcus sp. 6YEL10 TaxID=2745870 RepID=UPI001E379477|nr:tRNA-guanine transglycosylase [Deinococcus sp. 6YEL10]MCD0160871.1 tRNA-guanine transglycosylase [Deinococcus sp. 6YEL10]
MTRTLTTRKGPLHFPAFVPVTIFGEKYPLDDLIRPYLPRLAPAVMVSAFFLQDAREAPDLSVPLLVDSGGFASVFTAATVTRTRVGLGVIDYQGRRITPGSVLDLQERVADVGFTLDLLIPPGLPTRDARRYHALTRANALWALHNRRRTDLPLYGVVQGWDAQAAAELAQEYREAGFEGVAIGGLVPRMSQPDVVDDVIRAVRAAAGDLPIHAFGIGHPDHVARVSRLGVDSVDSSSYVKYAADGRLYSAPQVRHAHLTPHERVHLALCNLAAATGASLPLPTARFSTLTTRTLQR